MDKAQPRRRGLSVLRLLVSHGPLSIRAIETLISPSITRRKLREVVQRLEKHELVVRKYDRIFGGSGVFYQINPSTQATREIADVLDILPESVTQPRFRHAQLLHSEKCALWSERLKTLLPHCKVIRDHEFSVDPSIADLLMSKGEDYELLPDIIVSCSSLPGTNLASVAVEIERTPKTRDRLLRKLRKYADQTRLDGILYVCDKQALPERLRQIYNSEVLNEARRIRHYGQNFFLLSEATVLAPGVEPKTLNAALEEVSLISWVKHLSKTENTERRNNHFIRSGLREPLDTAT